MDARVQTRLGDGSIDIDVQGALVSPFTGAGIERLAVRATWLRGATPGTPARVVGYDTQGTAARPARGSMWVGSHSPMAPKG